MTTKEPLHGDHHDAPARHEPAPAPDAPPIQEYPKMLYHDGQTLAVQNADEEAKAKAQGFAPAGSAPPAKEPRR